MKYTPNWLALREDADARARDRRLIEQLGAALSERTEPLIVDLGCGTGALRRALTNVAPASARWRMVDHDPDVLAVARERFPEADVLDLDLAEEIERAVADADCVAATAFYDLVSLDWLDRFVRLLPQDAIVYAALTYDGREHWRPRHRDDADVLEAVHKYQRRDIGFGPALGPDAAAKLTQLLSERGWNVSTADAWWRLAPDSAPELVNELADGIAMGSEASGVKAGAWRPFLRHSIEIGHLDILALPSDENVQATPDSA
ncbi:MAG: class I SAM-dependent methyltransferase [Neomegalonema sp.]